ncbi:methylmalonyl-CoA mutase subunit beta [Robertkochia flava]|uniref:methylmalonyl-CoA mutase subunit beta n=1 Tax=Robertkochia flava TaxID=3447986 RepID=UPI001CCDF290|nr:methylmalonyl-CoA mutase subunit beta [Robertkochia marina]
MTKPLFDAFKGVSAKQWKQQIQFDLKGLDYNNTLLTTTPENITIKPFYHSEDLENRPVLQPTTPGRTWSICERIYTANEEKAAKKARHALEKGAESILFVLHDKKVKPEVLLSALGETSVPVYLEMHFLSPDFIRELTGFLEGTTFRVYLLLDPVNDLNASGNWHYNQKKDMQLLADILAYLQDKEHPGVANIHSQVSINLGRYLNSGASAIQQLAYALAHANEYLHLLEAHEIKASALQPLFFCGVGSNYFFEIAKIRALRVLWESLAGAYGNTHTPHILAIPGKRNKTLYDYNVNMLRTTTEYMSAILGGADTVCSMPYDSIYHKDNEFGSRIARNQLLVLKKESYFDVVDNPADGSYYIETLTTEMAEKALEIFKQIEAGGGYLRQLMDHTIQKKIKETAREEQEAFDRKERILVGTNKYINPEDRMKQDLELDPFLKKEEKKTLIEPIIEKRLAESLEKKRLKEE